LFPFFGGTKKIRWIHVEHGSSYVKDRNIIVRLISFLYDQILGRLIYRKADSIICVSRQTYLFAQGLGAPKEKLKIINESLNPKDWKIHIKKANKILQITFCGRLVKSKGIQEILRALMNLKKYFWQLNIVGSGIYEKNLKKLSDKLQISEKIIWHGGKDQQFIKKVLAKTDIYISASHSEGFGLSLIEAGICRCCILASDIGGHKDIIDHEKNGKLFKVGDFTDLEKGLRNLIINKEKREKFGKNLERKVKLYFNKDKMLDLYEKEFEKF
jgi:glycosyltransferase involved in cell wall biosynthesis